MDHDDAAAAFGEGLNQWLLRGLEVAAAVAMDDQHIGLIKLCLGGEVVATGGLRAALVEQRHPVAQEGRMIMRTRAMRLGAGTDEDAQRLGGWREKTEDLKTKEDEQGMWLHE